MHRSWQLSCRSDLFPSYWLVWLCIELLMWQVSSPLQTVLMFVSHNKSVYSVIGNQKELLLESRHLPAFLTYFFGTVNIKGFQPEWYISTMYHCRDTPIWSETLNMCYVIITNLSVLLSVIPFWLTAITLINLWFVLLSLVVDSPLHTSIMPFGPISFHTSEFVYCKLPSQVSCSL